MKKILVLLASMFLFNGCAETIALLGGASNGKIVQSSLQSGLSYGIKKQTGRSPFQHILTYSEITDQKICNTLNKKKLAKCNNTVTKQITSTKAIIDQKKQKINDVKSKVREIAAEKKISFKKQFAKARKEGKDFFTYNNQIYNTVFKENDVTKKTIKQEEKIIKQEKSETRPALFAQKATKKKLKIRYLD